MNRKNVFLRIMLLVSLVAMVFSLSLNAFAYERYLYHVADKRATYTWGGAIDSSSNNATYKQYWRNAITSWNSAVEYNLTYSTSSANDLTIVNEASSSNYGSMYPNTVEGRILRSFTARVNIAHTGTNSYVFRSAACHELGHTLGLGDFSDSQTEAIMNTSRDRTSVYTPKDDDINGVTAIYSQGG